jgi:electron transfer flavoprotein alpha subunit
MGGEILVVAEVLPVERGGRVAPLSLETLAAAQQLADAIGGQCSVAVFGDGGAIAPFAAELGKYKVAAIHAVAHPLLENYSADGFSIAMQQLIAELRPAYVFFPHTYQVRDYAPALATRFGEVLISDVIGVRDGPVFVRQLMQGKLNADYVQSRSRNADAPCFVSIQAGSFRAETLQAATEPAAIQSFAPTLEASQIRTTCGQPFRESAHTVDLASAPVIVSVGRGIREQENIPLVQALADALGAELAASRPICDAGWLPMERQVGSSGQTVSPKLYLAVGISGAIQHLVGMKSSKTVIAINKDGEAPIFELADYGVAGDLFEIVPVLTKAILSAKAG